MVCLDNRTEAKERYSSDWPFDSEAVRLYFEEAMDALLKRAHSEDRWFGKRRKAHFPRVFYNRYGRTWEVSWSYEVYRAECSLMGFFLLRGRVTGRIIGFQIWGSPHHLLWSLWKEVVQRF